MSARTSERLLPYRSYREAVTPSAKVPGGQPERVSSEAVKVACSRGGRVQLKYRERLLLVVFPLDVHLRADGELSIFRRT